MTPTAYHTTADEAAELRRKVAAINNNLRNELSKMERLKARIQQDYETLARHQARLALLDHDNAKS